MQAPLQLTAAVHSFAVTLNAAALAAFDMHRTWVVSVSALRLENLSEVG